MIFITNRNLQKDKPAEKRFGQTFNIRGPADITLAECKKSRGKWKVNVLPDEVMFKGQKVPASEKIFTELQEKMNTQKRNCLFFVHGFNNDFKEVIERGWFLQQEYGVEVVMFSWPANGGGGLKGVASYKSDKREAQLSVIALDRAFEKLNRYLLRYENSACKQKMTLLMHSMGNYLFKNLMKSHVYMGETLIFDNIVMAAADVNNNGHRQWVERIQYRNRLFITINERDKALFSSRAKGGEKQLARLGHYIKNLDAANAVYLDFTDAKHVGMSHAYFEDALENKKVRMVWNSILNGKRGEKGLSHNPHNNCFEI